MDHDVDRPEHLSIDDLRGETSEFAKTVGEFDVYQYAGITGDFGAFHLNAERMRDSIYGERIVQGVLLLGYLATASELYWRAPGRSGRGVALGFDRVRFVKPVFIGDTITARYEVTGWDGEKERFVGTGIVMNQHGETCLLATQLTKAIAVEQVRSEAAD